MGAIDNTNLTNLGRDASTEGFTPGVSYVYDATAAEVDVTDASVFPSGVSLLRTQIKVHDKFGNTANGSIENPNGSESGNDRTETIDVSGLNRSKPLDITATVIADDGKLVADGGAYNIGAAGTLGSWDAQKNA